MKKLFTFFFLLLLTYVAPAQEGNAFTQPNITVKWAPTGLLLGSVSLQAEYNFGSRNSLTAKIGLPVTAHHTFQYQGNDVRFKTKATSFLAGYRTYFSRGHLRGLYYEPFFKYVHHTSEGIGSGMLNNRMATFNFTNNYNGAGIGVQLGAQFFIGKRLVLDLFFLGPEINSASNSFKTVEITNNVPWSQVDASEAEKEIRDFINQFPFIRNRVNVMVDKETRRVNADFKGALPGLRTGISFGFAF